MEQVIYKAFSLTAINKKSLGHKPVPLCLNRSHKPPSKSHIKHFSVNNVPKNLMLYLTDLGAGIGESV
jgi:hypothetical protein